MNEEEAARLKELPKLYKGTFRKVPKSQLAFDETEYTIESQEGTSFFVKINRSTEIPEQYSAIIQVVGQAGGPIILSRYNGSSHEHPNHLEGELLDHVCHIHEFTDRYGIRKPSGYAYKTDRFNDPKGAFLCLLNDWNIGGFQVEIDLAHLDSPAT